MRNGRRQYDAKKKGKHVLCGNVASSVKFRRLISSEAAPATLSCRCQASGECGSVNEDNGQLHPLIDDR